MIDILQMNTVHQFILQAIDNHADNVAYLEASATVMHQQKFQVMLLDGLYDLTTANLEYISGIKRALISKWRTEKRYQILQQRTRIRFLAELISDESEAYRDLYPDAPFLHPALRSSFLLLAEQAWLSHDAERLLLLWPLVRSIQPSGTSGKGGQALLESSP